MERILSIDGVQGDGKDEPSKITLTFSADKTKLKYTDGEILDISNRCIKAQDV